MKPEYWDMGENKPLAVFHSGVALNYGWPSNKCMNHCSKYSDYPIKRLQQSQNRKNCAIHSKKWWEQWCTRLTVSLISEIKLIDANYVIVFDLSANSLITTTPWKLKTNEPSY